MNILALQLGHSATVLLMQDGQVRHAVSQEKFDNIKNSASFPHDAIEWILAKNHLRADQIDKVALCGLGVHPHQLETLSGDTAPTAGDSTLKRTFATLDLKYSDNPLFQLINSRKQAGNARVQAVGREKLLALLLERYGFAENQITFVEHHLCHAYSPAYFFDREGKDWLILSMDGSGDRDFAAVDTLKNSKIESVSRTPWKHSLGYVYSLTTRFLGMKPLEHEYKVMGLAAYAKPDYYRKTYEKIFQDVAWLKDDGSLQFGSKFPLNRFDHYLRDVCVGERFDNIAAALQHFLETLVLQWVRASVAATGIPNVMTSGGVFMNVKLNKLIQELPEVEATRFMPSCGDESNPFGGAFYVAEQNGLASTIRPLDNIYLGHSFTNEDVAAFIKTHCLDQKYCVRHYPDIESEIAALLADFEVVARVAGPAEFGARSLGNRAILANPSDMKSFYTVNDQIKARDFWMPFAPSLLDTDADRYLINPKHEAAPYMITAFDTKPLAYDHLRAAMHQGDHSVRPQIVTEKANSRYYKVIQGFKERTGIGGVMNTSYNLHGYPLAATLEQALFTFENSGLPNLALENYMISKRAAAS